MNCYNHPDRPAVIQCKHCGRGFCHEEAQLFRDGLCPECQQRVYESELLYREQQNKERAQREQAEAKANFEEERKWYRKVFKMSLVIGIPLYILSLFALEPTTFNLGSGLFFMILVFPSMVAAWYWSGKILTKIIQSMTPKNGGCLYSLFLYVFVRLLLFAVLNWVSLLLFLYTAYRAFRPMRKDAGR